MKLAARDIPAFMKAPAGGGYRSALLYGPDEGQARARAKAIAALIMGERADPMNLVELSGDQIKSDPARLSDELCAFSLMGGERVVVVRDATDKIAEVIADIFESISECAYLVVVAGELAAKSSLRRLYEREKRFAALACYLDEGSSLMELIRTTLTGYGLRVDRDAALYLSRSLGNDRGVTQQELAKIALYMGEDEEVTLAIAQALTGGNREAGYDDLCHAVATGDLAALEGALASMMEGGEAAVAILRALQRHFQRLQLMVGMVEEGVSPDRAMESLKPPVFFKEVPRFKAQLGRWNVRKAARALDILLAAEREVKATGSAPELLCRQALVRLAVAA